MLLPFEKEREKQTAEGKGGRGKRRAEREREAERGSRKELEAHKLRLTYNLTGEHSFIFQRPSRCPPQHQAAPDL